MRIELNAGGLSGIASIAEFADHVISLDRKMESMISSFEAVRKETCSLTGGVDPLGDALSLLNQRIEKDAGNQRNLADFARLFDDFLNHTMATDSEAARMVRQNREAFYRMNEHLRPPVSVDDFGSRFIAFWEGVGEAAGDFVSFVVEVYTTVEEAKKEAWKAVITFLDENKEIILTVTLTVVAIVGGIVLVVLSGGTAAPLLVMILGTALIGGGIGSGIAGFKSWSNTGEVDLTQVLQGFGFGFIAGAAVGASIAGATALTPVLEGSIGKFGACLVGEAIKGGGMEIAKDFLTQTVIEGDRVQGFEDYDVWQTVRAGFIGAVESVVIGGIMEGTGIEDGLTDLVKDALGGRVASPRLLHVISKMPSNAIKGGVESVVDYGLRKMTGTAEEPYTLGTLGRDVALSVFVDAIADSFEYRAEPRSGKVDGGEPLMLNPGPGENAPKLNPGPGENAPKLNPGPGEDVLKLNPGMSETEIRIRENIALSKAGREASRFGSDDLYYGECVINRKGMEKVLRNRGMSEEQITETIESFKRYSGNGYSAGTAEDIVMVSRPKPGTKAWVYSSSGNASKNYSMKTLYSQNHMVINDAALHPGNSALRAEEVIIGGSSMFTGTIAAQPKWAEEAARTGLDHIKRTGGAIQIVSDGSKAVKTGEIRLLQDTAGHLKRLGPVTTSLFDSVSDIKKIS